jgi:hypothetical protein
LQPRGTPWMTSQKNRAMAIENGVTGSDPCFAIPAGLFLSPSWLESRQGLGTAIPQSSRTTRRASIPARGPCSPPPARAARPRRRGRWRRPGCQVSANNAPNTRPRSDGTQEIQSCYRQTARAGEAFSRTCLLSLIRHSQGRR